MADHSIFAPQATDYAELTAEALPVTPGLRVGFFATRVEETDTAAKRSLASTKQHHRSTLVLGVRPGAEKIGCVGGSSIHLAVPGGYPSVDQNGDGYVEP